MNGVLETLVFSLGSITDSDIISTVDAISLLLDYRFGINFGQQLIGSVDDVFVCSHAYSDAEALDLFNNGNIDTSANGSSGLMLQVSGDNLFKMGFDIDGKLIASMISNGVPVMTFKASAAYYTTAYYSITIDENGVDIFLNLSPLAGTYLVGDSTSSTRVNNVDSITLGSGIIDSDFISPFFGVVRSISMLNVRTTSDIIDGISLLGVNPAQPVPQLPTVRTIDTLRVTDRFLTDCILLTNGYNNVLAGPYGIRFSTIEYICGDALEPIGSGQVRIIKSGVYLVSASITWDPSGSLTTRTLRIADDTGRYRGGDMITVVAGFNPQNITTVIYVDQSDVPLVIYVESNNAVNAIIGGDPNGQGQFQIVRIN
jgi:hypothetical protein